MTSATTERPAPADPPRVPTGRPGKVRGDTVERLTAELRALLDDIGEAVAGFDVSDWLDIVDLESARDRLRWVLLTIRRV